MTRKPFLILAAALSAASLAACSGSDPEPAPVEDVEDAAASSPIEERTPAPVATETALPAPAAEPPVTINAIDDVPSEEAPAPDEQMMDDAAATGMTARVTRDEPAATDETPAEQIEQK